MLRRTLPNFDVDNWTSELRTYAGLPAYEDKSVSDFQYRDEQGALTRMIFGGAIPDWLASSPEYFVEVKTTSGALGTPFHMSAAQIDLVSLALHCTQLLSCVLHMSGQARRFTRKNQIVDKLCIIFRVFNVHSALSFKIFPDPHQLFHIGALRVTSDVDVVAESS